MMLQVILFLAVLCFSDAKQLSFTRPFVEKWALPEVGTPNSTQNFTSGFLRIDTSNLVFKRWIRAQVLPIGVCFKKGNRGGSAKIVQVTMDSAFILQTTQTYTTSECSGHFSSASLTFAIKTRIEEFTHTVRHVPDIKTALVPEPATLPGLIISSYFSFEGCSGEAAQYDIFSTDECIVYDEPRGTWGIFYCNIEAEMMILDSYGIFDDPIPVLMNCGVPFTSTKLKLSCSDQSDIKAGQEKSPLFQTVRCTSGQVLPF